ncbi:MAG: caspase family protein [Pararhodobacter sp.]|nr:caspase family protein [Pararhodobacter sp.]
MTRLFAALVFLILALPAQAQSEGEGRLWGLAIGIDRYQAQGGSLLDLRGAVNDARDIAAALREAGAVEVALLLDEDAHRDAIFATIRDIARRADPGDSIVISYAGHGGREPTTDLVAEPDGFSEVTLLGGFRPEAPHNYQRIFDHEWRALVRELSDYTVVLVFDSCHSGTANRTVELPDAVSSVRFAQYGPVTDDLVPPARRAEGGEPAVLEHEVYLGATLDDLVVPEIVIGGQWRGALSVSFAQALRGRADAAGDGVLTRGELADFIDANVRTLSGARQFPQVVYPDFGTAGGDDRPLLARVITPVAATQSADQCSAAALAATPAQLAVHIAPDAQVAAAGLLELPELRQVDTMAAAGLTLMADPARPQLLAYTPTGDRGAEMPAHEGRPLSGDEARALAARWRLSGTLEQLAGCAAPLAARLTGPRGEGALHRWGEQVTLSLPPRDEPYLTMIVLNGTGAAQLLYPLPGDPESVDPSAPMQLDFAVTAPHGTDLLIVLASDAPQASLHRQLRQLDPRRQADHSPLLAEALAQTLAEGRHRIAVLPVHTAPR